VKIEAKGALAVALLRTAFCAYRAATQSIVHDEAFTYLNFVDGPWSKTWELFDANNHILHTLLVKLSVLAFGVSEFALRLPSVVAGFAMIAGVWRLLESVESRTIRWMAYLALALHPLLLDFSTSARGYGMSLSFLVWALYAAMRSRWSLSGYLLGLGISANLTLVFPALAVLCAYFLIQRGAERLRAVWLMLAPAVWMVAVFCVRPLRGATRGHFYVGLERLSESLINLGHFSMHISKRDGLFGVDAAARLAVYGIPLMAALWVALGIWAWRSGTDRRRLAAPLTLGVVVAGLFAARALLSVPYPQDRTALYLILLAGVTWAILADLTGFRWLRVLQMAVAGVLLLQFASQLQTRVFGIWRFNGAIKEVALRLREQTADQAPQSIAVSATVAQQPPLEFYRRQLGIAALKPVERQASPALTGFDYYVLSPPDAGTPEASGLRVLYSEPVSEIVLAR
jgi:hypothetical protein